MITISNAINAATKVEARLVGQGRDMWTARKDAAAWVAGNFGMFMGVENGQWVVLAGCCPDGQCEECFPIDDWDDE